ncbi:hypothetical protein HELRODRAFT_170601 [Helobdella robusta]|uniref:Large ribosomal subunit protein mL50 n=1 Tax=Helobdella robusta TaxID=6412 RepID=T1F383_HELRO|nr:hypothetical protein HELRODRAFT_170601 [Helobdella robusta]ESO07273.1 hypothetical protein HELRODRAFT_170601 [Helobdella robusta]
MFCSKYVTTRNSLLKLQTCTKYSRKCLFGRSKKSEVVEKKDKASLTSEEKQLNLDKESLGSINYNMGMLKKNMSLTTKKGYKPPENVEEIIEKVIRQRDDGLSTDWKNLPLNNHSLKFQILSSLIKEFNHDISNNELNNMKTLSDAVEYFSTEVKETSTYEDLASGKKTELPKNLHIQLEPLRFHPEKDTMFEGRTAFPGSNTIVSSLKYKRKYQGYSTSREKPGFNDYYYDY